MENTAIGASLGFTVFRGRKDWHPSLLSKYIRTYDSLVLAPGGRQAHEKAAGRQGSGVGTLTPCAPLPPHSPVCVHFSPRSRYTGPTAPEWQDDTRDAGSVPGTWSGPVQDMKEPPASPSRLRARRHLSDKSRPRPDRQSGKPSCPTSPLLLSSESRSTLYAAHIGAITLAPLTKANGWSSVSGNQNLR